VAVALADQPLTPRIFRKYGAQLLVTVTRMPTEKDGIVPDPT
jgi:hypothetical protein